MSALQLTIYHDFMTQQLCFSIRLQKFEMDDLFFKSDSDGFCTFVYTYVRFLLGVRVGCFGADVRSGETLLYCTVKPQYQWFSD